MAVTCADGVLKATMAALEAAGVVESPLGQQALWLAAQMGEAKSGSGLAAMSKELRSVLAEVAGVAEPVVDPVDELRSRRDAKRSG